MRLPTLILTAILTAAGLLPACDPDELTARAQGDIAPPLALEVPAFELAAEVPLPQREPLGNEDLHNVFVLSRNIVTGGEPLSEDAYRRLSEMGIRTILSVDGKEPDVETAAQLGMRTVHVPIRYKGIAADELLRITKTFRELPGPFYVHCFHGKHRGPAAAAVGRLVVDGVDRKQALAEMRQWCGTAEKYELLFRSVASDSIPTTEQTAALAWEFPARHVEAGYREHMVALARIKDDLVLLDKNGWQAPERHPDLDPLNEARKLVEQLRASASMPEDPRWGPDFFRMQEEAGLHAQALLDALSAGSTAATDGPSQASIELAAVSRQCADCHNQYRNH